MLVFLHLPQSMLLVSTHNRVSGSYDAHFLKAHTKNFFNVVPSAEARNEKIQLSITSSDICAACGRRWGVVGSKGE